MTLGPTFAATQWEPAQDLALRLLRDLVHERTGVYFESTRLDTLWQKLEPRLAARGSRTPLDYFYILKYDADSESEWLALLDALAVQETYFWRELDQIRALVDHVVPAWFQRSRAPLRIWSAACASGEEPYSIALALEEAGWGGHPIQLLASDASEAALAKAAAGFYRERSFRALPPELRERYFEPREDGFQLRRAIADRVTFRWANLMQLEALPEARQVDVIFCRNVFIYFSAAAIRQVATAFARRLPAGGPLFIGTSESLLKLTTQFELEELGSAFVYVRNSTP